jgi:hypothetical protein
LKKFILFFAVCASFFSCQKQLTRDEITARDKVRNSILNEYSQDFNIYVFPFKDMAGDEDLSYLKTAIPEMIHGILKPIGSETAYVDFDFDDFKLSSNVVKPILDAPQFFSEYITNIQSQTTQFVYQYVTNSNYFTYTNVYSNIVMDMTTNQMLVTLTNEFFDITTNTVGTNLVKTNIPHFPDENFYPLVKKEFPDITNVFHYLPVFLISEKYDTNKAVQYKANSLYIEGEFKKIPRRVGPPDIEIKVKLTKGIAYSNVIEMTNVVKEKQTNKVEVTNRVAITEKFAHTKTIREDRIASEVYDFIKPIRKLVLNRPTGDLIINSSPGDANVYLDGEFIGKSPLYYPAVPAGRHQFVFLKPGYSHLVVTGEIVENMTNYVHGEIDRFKTGGVVNIKSEPTNAYVFLDSSFVGTTPLTISNLNLGHNHRLKVMSFTDDGLKPYFHNIKLNKSSDIVNINANLIDYEGSPARIKRRAWLAAYSSWGLSIAILGFHYYSDYRYNHYMDLYNAKRDERYIPLYEDQEYWRDTALIAFVSTAILATGLTANALSREDIFIGFESTFERPVYASVSIRF